MIRLQQMTRRLCMGFWIFMCFMLLLTPLFMIGFGSVSKKKAPKEINGFYGYRTSMSMKNQDTWKFAHHYFGRLCYRFGWISLLISVIAISCVAGRDSDTVGNVSLIILGIQIILVIWPIFPTEKALKRTFDRDGNRR